MKLILLLSLVFDLVACSAPRKGPEDHQQTQTDKFELIGKWKIVDVKFTGDPRDHEFSKKMNLYSLLGTDWQQTQGKYFYFEPDGHWSFDAIDLDKSGLTYSFKDDLALSIKNDELDYNFIVPIIDSTEGLMSWDIGNKVVVTFNKED